MLFSFTFPVSLTRIRGGLVQVQAQLVIATNPHLYSLYLPADVLVECLAARCY